MIPRFLPQAVRHQTHITTGPVFIHVLILHTTTITGSLRVLQLHLIILMANGTMELSTATIQHHTFIHQLLMATQFQPFIIQENGMQTTVHLTMLYAAADLMYMTENYILITHQQFTHMNRLQLKSKQSVMPACHLTFTV